MKCGECTLCCELFAVKWLNKPVNTVCDFCNKGCTIHETKDDECKDFDCMYAQSEGLPVKLRPDNSKIIFEKHNDNFIVATQDARFDITDIAKAQIRAFLRQGFTVRLGFTDFRKAITWQPTVQI